MYIGILAVCMSVHHMHSVSMEAKRECLILFLLIHFKLNWTMVQAQFLISFSLPDLHLGLATNQVYLTFKLSSQESFLSANFCESALLLLCINQI